MAGIGKMDLIRRNLSEIVSEEEFVKLIKTKKKPSIYCGYEPSGDMHLGHFVTVLKLADFAKAGFRVKILLADIHAMLNRKGDEKLIMKEVDSWKRTIKAIGLDADVVLGSDYQFKKSYQFDVMRLAQSSTINRGLRSMQEIARDVKNATISQLWYPLMQVADIKHLKVDVALGGLEQRKVHMIGKDMSKTLGHDFVAVHTPLITSLKGPGSKMSKSIPGSGISVTDSPEAVKKNIMDAYCPAKIVEDNPVLQISKLIIFPMLGKLDIERDVKFGGNLGIENYDDLEKMYSLGELHPLDLKKAVAVKLEEIIAPIRKKFK